MVCPNIFNVLYYSNLTDIIRITSNDFYSQLIKSYIMNFATINQRGKLKMNNVTILTCFPFQET